ncbi:MAG: BamA/TamA family outer membrane protein [Psittacicella sp.]
MKKYKFFLKIQILIIFLIPSFVYASNLQNSVNISGINNNPAIIKNINKYILALNEEVKPSYTSAYIYVLKNHILNAIEAYSYFHPTIEIKAFEKPNIHFKVNINIGKPILVKIITLKANNSFKKTPFFKEIKNQLPKINSILNQQKFDSLISKINLYISSNGYLSGKVTKSSIELNLKANTANLIITINSGSRYKFGQLIFNNPQIQKAYIYPIIGLKKNQYYNLNYLRKINANLDNAGWFKYTIISPKINKKKKEVDLNIYFKPQNEIETSLGLGYDTDVGAYTEVSFSKAKINSYGQSARIGFYLSRYNNNLNFTYRIPLKSNPLNNYYKLTTKIGNQNTRTQLQKTNNVAWLPNNNYFLSFARYWKFKNNWILSGGLNYEKENYSDNNSSETGLSNTFVYYIQIKAQYSSYKNILFLHNGFLSKIVLNAANNKLANSTGFTEAEWFGSYTHNITKNQLFIARSSLGILKADNFNKVPINLRLFAGGMNSVRGFAYDSISPTNSSDEYIGGTHMATASFEYFHRIYRNLWGSAYIDSGIAADSFAPSNIHYGAGIGINYNSPIGFIRLDIATPLNYRKDNSIYEAYIGIGINI